MEALHIASTEETPEINFDVEKKQFSISGKSLPEDSIAFYAPVFEWLQQFVDEVQEDVEFEFFMDYFNTSSAKQLAKIFLFLEKLNEKVFVQVVWKYKKDDNDMMASGVRFSKLLNIEFELRAVE